MLHQGEYTPINFGIGENETTTNNNILKGCFEWLKTMFTTMLHKLNFIIIVCIEATNTYSIVVIRQVKLRAVTITLLKCM